MTFIHDILQMAHLIRPVPIFVLLNVASRSYSKPYISSLGGDAGSSSSKPPQSCPEHLRATSHSYEALSKGKFPKLTSSRNVRITKG